MLKDIPIIFSGPMVRALIDGRKTMTRRLAWTLPGKAGRRATRRDDWPAGMWPSSWQNRQPGDRLWVRENFAVHEGGVIRDAAGGQMDVVDAEIVFAADRKRRDSHKWTPCIHMPRSYSRITLVVRATKIEPLQSMSPEDAIAEGMKGLTKDGNLVKYGIPDRDGLPGNDDHGWHWHDWRISPVDAFEHLWWTLHGGESWKANPDVVALTFTVHKYNIDAMPKAEAA